MPQTGSGAGKPLKGKENPGSSMGGVSGKKKPSRTERKLSGSPMRSKYSKSESESYRKADAKGLKGQSTSAADSSKSGKESKKKDIRQKDGEQRNDSQNRAKKTPTTSSRGSDSDDPYMRDILRRTSTDNDKATRSKEMKMEKTKSKVQPSSHRSSSLDRKEARLKAAEAALSRYDVSKNIGFAKESRSEASVEKMAVQSVLFVCPVVSNEILPSKYWRPKIISYLADLSKTEKELSSVLMIHTLNSNKEKVDDCVQILTTYLKNILTNPDDDKYKSIKTTNKVFSEKVLPVKGAVEFLNAAGFRKDSTGVDGGEVEVMKLRGPADTDKLEMLSDAVRCAEPVLPQVYRDPTVLKPHEAEARVYLPEDFYDLTEQELTEMYKKNLQKTEEDMPLLTKAMRVKEERKHLSKYKYSVLRFRFPDSLYLQGTFARYETQKCIKEFVDSCLVKPFNYSLLPPLSKQPLSQANDDKTLLDLKLIPAVILTVIPDDKEKFPKVYLKSHVIKNIKPL